MHPTLKKLYDETIATCRDDPRVLGAWEFGSLGEGTGDAYSDVDPVFMVRDEDFDAVDRELRPLFERMGARIALWWPESFNSDDIKNFAILFGDGDLLQYDMTIAKESSVQAGFGKVLLTGSGPVQILFDKTGLLRALLDAPPPDYTPSQLVWQIERYWVYVYIHVKYLKRADTFKLLYAQQTLFHNHLDILKALHPGYWGWWPWSVKHLLSEEKQAQLLAYFGPPDRDSVAAALAREIDLFAQDAHAACAAWNRPYPEALDAEIRAHLARHMGIR